MSENYFGFYTTPPVWAREDFDVMSLGPTDAVEILFSQMVFERRNSAFSLFVCRDGLFMLQVSALEKERACLQNGDEDMLVAWHSKYLNHLNCLYLLLESTVLKVLNLSFLQIRDLARIDMIDIMYSNNQQSGSGLYSYSYNAWLHDLRSIDMTHRLPFVTLGLLRPKGRTVLPLEVLEGLANDYAAIVEDNYLVDRLSTITKSIAEYKLGNFPVSLTLAWFVIESYINQKWDGYLASKNRDLPDSSRRINKERRKNLQGRDYTVSVVSNFLELSDVISTAQYLKLDRVRGLRNKVVHQEESFTVKAAHCREAISFTLELILEGRPLDVRVNLGYQL